MKIPHYGEVTFRVRTGLYDFRLRLHRVHRHLSLFRKFPTDSGYWSLEEFSRHGFEDRPFRAVIQIDGTHRSNAPTSSKLEDVLGRLRGPQDDYLAPSVIRFEIRPEAHYADWYHAQPGADTPWLVGTAGCSVYHLKGYFESVLTALEECYPGLIEFDTPSASPEVQTTETEQHDASSGERQAETQDTMFADGPPKRPDEPSQQAPTDKWFDWYHECKKAGFKVTLREIGDKIGYKESTMKQKHALYKAERGLKSSPTSSESRAVPK